MLLALLLARAPLRVVALPTAAAATAAASSSTSTSTSEVPLSVRPLCTVLHEAPTVAVGVAAHVPRAPAAAAAPAARACGRAVSHLVPWLAALEAAPLQRA